MEKEHCKFRIHKQVENLLYFDLLFKLSNKIEIVGELEITPYQSFKSEFGSIYWYIQYMLLKNGKFEIDKDEIETEYYAFFSETEVNFEWLTLKDEGNYLLRCVDGCWEAEIYNPVIQEKLNLYNAEFFN